MTQEVDYKKEVAQLKAQVKKLQTLLLATGQQVMQLQVEQRKLRINDIGAKASELQTLVPGSVPPSQGSGNPRPSEYVTESDLNDMVMELQGQFNILDEKSIKRSLNSASSSDLVSVPNADGEYSPSFPNSIAKLQSLNKDELFKEWVFLELMPGVEQIDDILVKDDDEENKKILAELYDSFATFIGVNPKTYPWKFLN